MLLSSFMLLGIVIVLTYGIGSLCSAVIVARLCHLPDPRLQGSRNPGTTNILRIAGKKYAVIVLLADLLKGLLPVLLVKWSHFAPEYLGYIGLAAVIGHIYPVFFGFKGGKNRDCSRVPSRRCRYSGQKIPTRTASDPD